MNTAERLAQMLEIWNNAPTTFPVPADPYVDVEGERDDYRELTDGEYDRIADAYERRLGL